VEKYQKSSPWSGFGSIKAIGDDMVIDDDATDISSPATDSSLYGGDVYDLQGRKMAGGALRKGIYIRDGRKVISD